MKKFVILFVLLPLLYSCSSDEATSVETEQLTNNGFLLKRVDVISPFLGTGSLYSYNGNKLDKIGTEPDFIKYIYTGSLISQKEYYQNSVLVYKDFFSYNAQDKLIEHKVINYEENIGSRFVYSYNSDNSCNIQLFSGDLTIQNNLNQDFNRKLFFENGWVTKTERNQMINGNLETLTTAYTYDDKKNPYYYSVLGYNKLVFYDTGYYISPNNLISYTYSATNTSIVDIDVIEYTYNSYDFPITRTIVDPNDNGNINIIENYYYQQP